MNFKRFAIWLSAIVAASLLLVGRLTGFTYSNLEIQLHDTYYIFDPFTITFITVITLSLVSLTVTSVKILRTHHIFLQIILILIISAILFIPMLMLSAFVMGLFAG